MLVQVIYSRNLEKLIVKRKIHKSEGSLLSVLEKATGGPLTLAKYLKAIRESDEMTQVEFAEKLGISKANLNDIEKGRKLISPERAARFAGLLGYSAPQFVALALQGVVDHAGLKFKVEVKVA